VLVYDGAVTFTNCTLTANRTNTQDDGFGALNAGGGIFLWDGTALLHNTLVAGNLRGGAAPVADDVPGTALDPASAGNLIGTGGAGGLVTGVNGNRVGVADPGLAPLADNGGPTLTCALLPGSPARDAGDNALVPAGLATDQRGPGFARVLHGTVDVGAFEYHNSPPTNVGAGGPYAVGEGAGLTLAATATDPDGDALTYAWDVNGDGVFGDASGANPTLSWAQLNALGITFAGDATTNLRVRVSDGVNPAVTSAATSLTVTLPVTPANVVQLRQAGTTLYVTGDNLANRVVIAATATGLEVRPGSTGTRFTLFGSPAAPAAGPFTFTGVQAIIANLGRSPSGGTDRLVLDYRQANLTLSGGLSVQGMGGDLAVLTRASAGTALTVGGQVSLIAGAGRLTTTWTNAAVAGALTVNHLAGGDSAVTLDTLGASRNRLASFDLEAGTGFDRVAVADTDVATNLTLNLGNGPVGAALGSQTDLRGVTVGGLWRLTAGTGADVVNVQTAAGQSRFGSAAVSLGAGDDRLTLAPGGVVEFLGTATLDGGAGAGDVLTQGVGRLVYRGVRNLGGWELFT
jgi:hypothetical protein